MKPVNALDCPNDAATLRGRTFRPHRNSTAPRALCVVDPTNPDAAAALIYSRVKVLRRAEGAGSYLFIDPAMNVYVLNEQSAHAADWAVSHWAWFVGAYKTVHREVIEGLTATLPGICEDVRDHLVMSVQA